MAKAFVASSEQAQTIINKVDNLDEKIQPVGLNGVEIGVVDFVNDNIVITTGGLDQYARRITT